jgi:hypothetical protein
MSTTSSALIESICISTVSTPYSLEKDSLITVAGSFPGFLAITTPAPNFAARADAMIKPRLSIPTILVIPLSL